MSDKAEMPDVMYVSAWTDEWGYSGSSRDNGDTAYIRADLHEEQAAEIAALKAENNTLRADAINAARLADQLIDMHRSGWIITNSILGASVLNEVLGHLRGDTP